MRRFIACSIVAIVSWLAAPSEAMARRGFLRWLDELSGPGPFHGGGLELPAVCYGHDEFAGREAPPRLFSVIDCWRIDSGRRKFVVGVEFALLRTGSNPLLYAPARRAQSPDVTLTWIMPTFETNLHRAVDIGVGVGVAAFGESGSIAACTSPSWSRCG